MADKPARAHQWVMFVQVPVDVVLDYEDERVFHIVLDRDKAAAAEEAAVHGCAACSTPLNATTAKTNCAGEDTGMHSGS